MPSLKSYLRDLVERITLLRELKYLFLQPLHAARHRDFSLETHELCRKCIQDVLACPDYALIPRVADAGKIRWGRQTMHNGIKVLAGSYYGPWVQKLIEQTRGIHEPQEERVFAEVLKDMPPRATMIELGAYWGFYSLWFHKLIVEPTCYLVEPRLSHLNFGRKHFKMNGMKGHFTQAYVGEHAGTLENTPMICVDDFVDEHKIQHIDILHVDIQGAEVDMLRGAVRTIARDAIDYVFLSTHSNELHDQCRQFLLEHHFTILASANLDESYAQDGVLVARRTGRPGVGPIDISLKTTARK